MMKIILFEPSTIKIEARFSPKIHSVFDYRDVEVVRTIEDLTDTLIQPSDEPKIAILYPKYENDLTQLLVVRDLLEEYDVILILNFCDEQTLRISHLLRARFICNSSDEFQDLLQVLKRKTVDLLQCV